MRKIKMRLRVTIGMVFLFQALVTSAAAQEMPDSAIVIGNAGKLYSAQLKEERSYWVYLPAHYNDEKFNAQRYPVLYLLDGDANFHAVTGIQQFLSKGPYAHLPEMIVVGILNTNRTRDMTPTYAHVTAMNGLKANFESSGGGAAFARFLQEEMIPTINKHYRTLDYRVLTGHSFGGLAAVNILLHQPRLFNAYLAIDPSLWWDHEYLLKQADSILAAPGVLAGRQLYMTLAHKERSVQDTTTDQERAIRRFVSLLDKYPQSGLLHQFAYYKDEDHGSIPLPSELYGLRFIFKGYQTQVKQLAADPLLLEKGYQALSERLQFSFLPPEYLVDWIAQFCKANGNMQQAIYFLEMNVRNYPESADARKRLQAAQHISH